MKPPTDSKGAPPDGGDQPDRTSVKRPGGHGSYELGGEPAIGQRWHQTPPPPPATMTRFDDLDDGVPHRPHPPGDDDPLHNEDIDHEHRDVNLKAVIGSAIVLAAVAVVSWVAMWLLFVVLENQAAARDPQVSPLAPPPVEMPKTTRDSPFFNSNVGGVQLMTNEPMGLTTFRAEEQKRLQGYGWVNQAGGVAHVPIEEAKKLLKERGLPVREGEAAAPALGTRLPAFGESSGGRVITSAPSSQPSAAPAAAPGQGAKPHQEAPAAKPPGPGGH